MPKMPEEVKKDWENRAGSVVLSTVDSDGTPNSIYATCVGLFEDSQIVVANNYFDKTMKNIQAGSRASVVFLTEEKKSYQVKGSLEYHENGPVFDFMNSWTPEKYPRHGAVAVNIDALYSGADKLV